MRNNYCETTYHLAVPDNEGAGFWWANGRNALTNNVAVECDQYGFRFQIPNESQEQVHLYLFHPSQFITKTISRRKKS